MNRVTKGESGERTPLPSLPEDDERTGRPAPRRIENREGERKRQVDLLSRRIELSAAEWRSYLGRCAREPNRSDWTLA